MLWRSSSCRKSRSIALLEPFYLALNGNARRIRFGCAVSDDSIASYCRGFIATGALGFGCLSGARLVAIVELHSFCDRGELAFASIAEGDNPAIFRRLPLLATSTAGRLACRSLVIEPDTIEPRALPSLREVGELKREPQTDFFELAGFNRENIGLATMLASHE